MEVTNLLKTKKKKEQNCVDELSTRIDKMSIEPKLSCSKYGAGYVKKGMLERHMKNKHESTVETNTQCPECEKVLCDDRSLKRHMKTHLECKRCNMTFESSEDCSSHKREHTICKICGKDFLF